MVLLLLVGGGVAVELGGEEPFGMRDSERGQEALDPDPESGSEVELQDLLVWEVGGLVVLKLLKLVTLLKLPSLHDLQHI